MKEKREKMSLIIAAVAVVLLIGFLFVIQVIQSNSQKKLLQQLGGATSDTPIKDKDKDVSDLFINEVNAEGWVELFNKNSSELDLSGFYLEVNGVKVNIANGITIENEGYVVIEITDLLVEESDNLIELYSRRDAKIDSCLVGALEENQSYARTEDAANSFAIMQSTKEKPNSEGKKVDVESVIFDVPSGFYSDKISVSITAGKNQKIYYTLDGTDPTTESEVYKEPIEIDDRSSKENIWSAGVSVSATADYTPGDNVDKCTVLKAIAVDEDGNQSEIKSSSYYIAVGDKSLYDNIPVVSIVTNPEDMFDYYKGLYTLGRTYDDMLAQEKDEKIYANYLQGWETDVLVQFFGPDHYNTKNITTKLKIYEDETVDLGQKSLQLTAEDEKYVLSSCKLDYMSKSRQGLANKLLEGSNIIIPSDMYIVFIDGEFWGLYQFVIPFDSEFVASQTDGNDEDIVTAVNGVTDKSSKQGEYDKLREFVINSDMSTSGNYDKVCKMMDVQSYANYICGSVFLANYDEKLTEYMWKDSSDNLWKWAIGNQTNSLGGNQLSKSSIDTFLRPAFAKNTFLNKMMQNSKFRELLLDTMNKMCDTCFNEENVEKVTEDYSNLYGKAIVETWNRFSGSYAIDSYKLELNNIKEFIADRIEYIKFYTEEYVEKASTSKVGGTKKEDD